MAASYDESGRYGTQSPFSPSVAGRWKGGKWHVDGTRSTLVTVGNGGPAEARVGVTIFYDSGRQRYELPPATLSPEEQLWLDFGELIRQQVPDREGRLLPAGLSTGSYELRQLESGPAGSLYEGKLTIDRTYGHVTYGCAQCCAIDSIFMDPWTLSLAAGGSGFVNVQGSGYCGVENVTHYTYGWATGNSSIALAHGAGNMEGVNPGSTWELANADVIGPPMWGFCSNQTQQGSGNTNVKPQISGPNTVWWFNGQDPNPSSYPISVVLTVTGGQASTTWEVLSGGERVLLSSNTGAEVSVTSTGDKFSGAVGDISIRATVNGQPSAPFAMTSRRPWKLVPRAPQTLCGSFPDSYLTFLRYDVRDNLDTLIAQDIGWNEPLGTAESDNGSNWAQWGILAGGAQTDPLEDLLAPPKLDLNPSPTPTCSGSHLGTTRYRKIPQTIKVGSTSTGSGVIVQTDVLGYYIDHGRHDNVQVPPQPPQ